MGAGRILHSNAELQLKYFPIPIPIPNQGLGHRGSSDLSRLPPLGELRGDSGLNGRFNPSSMPCISFGAWKAS